MQIYTDLYRSLQILQDLLKINHTKMTNELLLRIPSFQQVLKLLQQTIFPKITTTTLYQYVYQPRRSHVKFHPSKRSQYGKRASQS